MKLETLDRIKRLFNDLGWEDDDLFDRFVGFVDKLSPDEADLVLTVTQDFFLCTYPDYDAGMAAVFDQIRLMLSPVDVVIAVPLLKKTDEGKVKSGSLATYLLRTMLERHCRHGGCASFRGFDRVSMLEKEADSRGGAKIIFADDFIGSGSTAVSCLNWYASSLAKPGDTVIVATLVGQERGLDVIARHPVAPSIAVAEVRKRGITDSTHLPDTAEALRVMDALEAKLGVSASYRRGYEETEALVSMIRCPNNTFPAYWWDRDSSGRPWPSPFDR